MKILVTGGLGYIGSHTVVELQNEGFDVVIIDNLSNSYSNVLDGIVKITNKTPLFENFDLQNQNKTQDFFKRHQDIDGVIHFAASKSVGESIEKPLFYYQNNVNTLVNVLQNLKQQSFVFSSSCSIYGNTKQLPTKENSTLAIPLSPYGQTKKIGESILKDVCATNANFNAIALRYFNPIGAHPSTYIGELPIGTPQNLVPYITQTAIGLRKQLSIFGNDYPTPDGTCIRDYIHVMDVAKAHSIALKRLLYKQNKINFEAFNIGFGKGSSVLEVIRSFERISKKTLNYKIVERRKGDPAAAYADTTKAKKILGWEAQLSLDDALKSAWQWEQSLKNTP